MTRIELFIDGAWTAGAAGRTLDIVNPATEAVIGQVAVAETADLDRALAAAERGFAVWRRTSALDRSKILRKAGDLLRERAKAIGATITAEQGKPLAEAVQEVGNCADILDWCAEEGRRAYGRLIPSRQPQVVQSVRVEPIGPVAAFSPWNFPASQAARKIAAALAAGCSIIIKAPEEVPSCSAAIVQALAEAGLPAGVVNLVFGHPPDISSHLIASPVIRKVSFTGSVPVGKHLARLAADHMKPCTMELGGHSPVLVFDDVDPVKVGAQLAGAKFRNAGQVCISPTRFYVQDPIYDRFADSFAAAAEKVVVADGAAAGTQMGPLANKRRLEAVDGMIADAVAKGATVRTGGRRIGNSGYFYAPTVLTDVPPEARILTEEPFGPVVILSRFSGLEDGLALANRSTFGLAAYGFTRSAATVEALSAVLEAGMITINHFGLGLTETPFGGIKESGYGREGGSEGLQAYLVTKFVSHLAA